MNEEKVMIREDKRVDEFTTVPVYREDHPGICKQCGADVLVEAKKHFIMNYGTEEYDRLPNEAKTLIDIMMANHVRDTHEKQNKRMLKESEMPVGCINGKIITRAEDNAEKAKKQAILLEKKRVQAENLGY